MAETTWSCRDICERLVEFLPPTCIDTAFALGSRRSNWCLTGACDTAICGTRCLLSKTNLRCIGDVGSTAGGADVTAHHLQRNTRRWSVPSSGDWSAHRRRRAAAGKQTRARPVSRKLLSLCQATNTDIESLDLALEDQEGLLSETAFCSLEDFALVVAVVDGLGESLFLGILHMASIHPDPLLELRIALVDFVFEGGDLQVLGLDLLHEMGHLGGDVGHWVWS